MIDHQIEMRQVYANGFPGVFISGIVWLTAGLVAQFHTGTAAMASLFVGGMFIHPASSAIARICFHAKPSGGANPLNRLAIESTALLFVGLFIAYAMSFRETRLFFSTMLMIIGARYLLFQSLYGLKIYWGLGGILIAAGIALTVAGHIPTFVVCYVGSGIEVLSGAMGMAKTTVREPR